MKLEVEGQNLIKISDMFFSPYNARAQSAPHNSIFTVSLFKHERRGSINQPPALNVASDATVLIGTPNISPHLSRRPSKRPTYLTPSFTLQTILIRFRPSLTHKLSKWAQ